MKRHNVKIKHLNKKNISVNFPFHFGDMDIESFRMESFIKKNFLIMYYQFEV